MKIHLLSDLHSEFEDFNYTANDADVVVLAGDVNLGTKGVEWIVEKIKDKPVIYVLGNHEYYKNAYPKLVQKIRDVAAGTNVHLLENESIEIGEVRFHGATLWTDFELFGSPRIAGYECQQVMNDFKKIRRDPSYAKLRSIDVHKIHKKSIAWLESSLSSSTNKINIVVTHHGPSLQSVPEFYQEDIITSAYVSDLEQFIKKMKPDYWFHGHLHKSSDYNIDNTRVICNPKGYPDEPNYQFDPQLVIEC